MARMILAVACAVATAAGATRPSAAQTLDRWTPLIAEAAARFAVPADWLRRVMRAESGGAIEREGRPITSPKGAMGLMQIMPDTYAELRAAYGFGPDPYAPRDNIFAGAAYLRAMFDRFGMDGAFAAYNAGPARYEAYLRVGRPLPDETIAYLAALETPVESLLAPRASAPAGTLTGLVASPPGASGWSIFFVREGVRLAPRQPPPEVLTRRAASLFVTLKDGAPRREPLNADR